MAGNKDPIATSSEKIEKLDNALLFCLASMGIITSFIEINKNDFSQLIAAIPFLLLGIVIPFFIGYVRGSISKNNFEERIRGWIYFFVGLFSYVGFYISFRLSNFTYIIRESMFLAAVIVGLIFANEFVKWARKEFSLKSRLSSYSFSATSFGALIFAFSSSFTVGFLTDLINNLSKMKSISSDFVISAFFWFTIILFSVLLLVIFETASRYAIEPNVRCGEYKQAKIRSKLGEKLESLLNISILKACSFAFVMFEYTFDYNLKARVLWIQSFIFWVLGCFLWMLGLQSVGLLFYFLTIFCFFWHAISSEEQRSRILSTSKKSFQPKS